MFKNSEAEFAPNEHRAGRAGPLVWGGQSRWELPNDIPENEAALAELEVETQRMASPGLATPLGDLWAEHCRFREPARVGLAPANFTRLGDAFPYNRRSRPTAQSIEGKITHSFDPCLCSLLFLIPANFLFKDVLPTYSTRTEARKV